MFIICADGGKEDGFGHISRCLTLARHLHKLGASTIFLSHSNPGIEFLTLANIQVEISNERSGSPANLNAVSALASKFKNAIIVLDSKNYSVDAINLLSNEHFVVLIDDDLQRDANCNVIVNNNIWVNENSYSQNPRRNLLLGPTYNLIREDFFTCSTKRPPSSIPRLLITLGGEDPNNVTSEILCLFAAALERFQVNVVIGGGHPNPDQVRRDIKHHTPFARLFVNATNMPDLMTNADLAITACGTTTYELCASGVAQLGIVIDDHQDRLSHTLSSLGCMIVVGSSSGLEKDLIKLHLVNFCLENATYSNMIQTGGAIFKKPGVDGLCQEILSHHLGWIGQHENRR